MMALWKIFVECHTIVVNGEFLRDVVHRLKTCRNCNRHRVYEIMRLLNYMRSQEKKIKYVEVYESLKGVPREDIDVASFALQSRDRVLLVANIDSRLADEKLVKELGERYGVNVLSTKEFLED